MVSEQQLQDYKTRLSTLETFSSLSDDQQTQILKILLEDMLPGQSIESIKRLPNELVRGLPLRRNHGCIS